MVRFRDPRKSSKPKDASALDAVRSKFAAFLALLERHHQAMTIISDMEEKSQGDYLFDLNYIRTSIAQIRNCVSRLIEIMIELGGPRYEILRDRYADIGARIDESLPWCRSAGIDRYVLPLDEVGRDQACSVGSKNAQVGEMKSRLHLPTPNGFAVTAWSCRYFRQVHDLDERISKRLASVNFLEYDDLVRVSNEIQSMINECPLPDDLAEAIRRAYDELIARRPDARVALRSSALGEDSWFSFAGQYATFLNVEPDRILERYREILASKFTPKAIYYLLSHSLVEDDLAMGVGLVEMIDARAAGVVYTRDPVNPESTQIQVHAVLGLGKSLVEGRSEPDVFHVDRGTMQIVKRQLARKTERLVMADGGGTVEESVPEIDQTQPALSDEQVRQLAEYAVIVETHYNKPQDIEWAVDRDERVMLLQTRPLKIVSAESASEAIDVSGFEILRSGGVTVCPGAATGYVIPVSSIDDLPGIPDRAILVTHQPFPGLVTVMGRIAAIITEVGGPATHMATIAREYRIPTITGIDKLPELPRKTPVTVDATEGTIYSGAHPELVEARQPDYNLFSDMDIFRLLEDLLVHVSPLHLVQPADPGFVPDNCRTLHDITRYVHQKAIEEMFYGGMRVGDSTQVFHRLKTDVPLTVDMIYLDRELPTSPSRREVPDTEIGCKPMEQFWSGLKSEGWPHKARPKYQASFPSVLGLRGRESGYSENSFAVISREYMVLSLRMGYHFSTIEALATTDSNKNYVRFQHKQGGASLPRRIRRVNVISGLLARLGFVHQSKGDFLSAGINHLDGDRMARILYAMGRLTVMTKQLDMALSTDQIAEWYMEDFAKRLGIGPGDVSQ